MTYVQWWCTGVMLGRNVHWPLPLRRGENAGQVRAKTAPERTRVPQAPPKAASTQSVGRTFDRFC